MEKEKKAIISELRCCLLSVKGKLPVQQLNRDYKSMIGEYVPFKKMGYKSFEDFLDSLPEFHVTTVNGETFVHTNSTSSSAHISQMVNQQKTSKKKNIPRRPRFRSYQSYQPSYQPSYQSANSSRQFRPNFDRHSSQLPRQPRFIPPSRNSDRQSLNTRLQMKSHEEQRTPTYEHTSKNIQSVTRVEKSANNVEKPVNKVEKPSNTVEKPSNTLDKSANRVMSVLNETSGAPVVKVTVNGTGKENTEASTALHSTKKRLSARMREIKSSQADSHNHREFVKPRSFNLGKAPVVDEPITTSNNAVPSGKSHIMGEKIATSPNAVKFDEPLNFLRKPVKGSADTKKEFVATGNHVSDLINFAKFHGLEKPNFRVNQFKSIKGVCASVSVDNRNYVTFPDAYKTEELAKKHCSEKALKELLSIHGYNRSMFISDPKDVLQRIPQMLEKHSNAIWEWQVQHNYIEKYNEELPSDWLKIVDSSPCVLIDKALGGCILAYCQPGTKRNNLTLDGSVPYVSVPSNIVELGSDRKLSALVTCIVKANEIWCRQDNTEDSILFNEIDPKMQTFYEQRSTTMQAEPATKDCYYAIKQGNKWFRVRVVNVTDIDVVCFLIDTGDTLTVPKNKIFQLSQEFAIAQAQAFVCRLYGLEHLFEVSEGSKCLDLLENKRVIIEVVTDPAVDESDPCLSVIMYHAEMNFSYNDELERQLSIEAAQPILQKGKISEVFVSNIASNGDVYVQCQTDGFYSFLNFMNEVETFVVEDPPTHLIKNVTPNDDMDKIYFGIFKDDDHWYRIRIKDWSPNGDFAQIYFIDYGNTDIINVKEELLYPLNELEPLLALYPPQAVRVHMSLDNIPHNFDELATKLMPMDQPVLLKILNYDNDGIPYADFFKRNSDDEIFCINKSITMEAELKEEVTKVTNNNVVKKTWPTIKTVPSGGRLPCPILPEKGRLFEVCVSFAVSPWNFFVQPLKTRPKLQEMMRKMQDRYNNVQFSPLPMDSIVPGMIYASKYEDDGNWYRTTVLKVINETSISVFYCDYGHYTNLTVYHLIPLDSEFMELPYQALKAKISDIKPVHSKWMMEDCEEFRSMVDNKYFYTLLVDIEKDELYQEDIVLNLIMIDTSSSDDDVYISKELIKKGRAVSVDLI